MSQLRHSSDQSALLAVPFIRTGPVGRPVGEPPAGSRLISNSWFGVVRGRFSSFSLTVRAASRTPIDTGPRAWSHRVQISRDRPGGTGIPSRGTSSAFAVGEGVHHGRRTVRVVQEHRDQDGLPAPRAPRRPRRRSAGAGSPARPPDPAPRQNGRLCQSDARKRTAGRPPACGPRPAPRTEGWPRSVAHRVSPAGTSGVVVVELLEPVLPRHPPGRRRMRRR